MTTKDLVQKLLTDKTIRQARLNTMSQQLQELDTDLFSSKVGRWFGSTYLSTKRFLTLLLGIVFVIGAIYIMVSPETIFNEKFTNSMVEESKENYYKKFGKTIGETIVGSVKSDEELTPETINVEFNKAFENMLLAEFYSGIRFLAVLLIPLALFLLYISRLTKKMRIRNKKISEAQTLTQSIILQFQEEIKNSELDVQIIRGIVNEDRM